MTTTVLKSIALFNDVFTLAELDEDGAIKYRIEQRCPDGDLMNESEVTTKEEAIDDYVHVMKQWLDSAKSHEGDWDLKGI